jgi:hypothetical protein
MIETKIVIKENIMSISNLVLLTLATVFTMMPLTSQAEVIECKQPGIAKYLFALQPQKNLVFKSNGNLNTAGSEHYSPVLGKVIVKRNEGNGIVSVLVATDAQEIDWDSAENRKKCFIALAPKIKFDLSVGSSDDNSSVFTMRSNLVKNPNKDCNTIPAPGIPRPQSLKCKLL